MKLLDARDTVRAGNTWKSAPCTPVKPMEMIPSTKKAESYHVLHKVPVGDSPYVKAKHVQLIDKAPGKAISLFWAAINSGDRIESALKDMVIVMKQLDRAEEGVEAIKSFRHLCSHEAQESLDNVLLDLYKRCGSVDEQIELLEHKLKLLEEGVRFNGNKKNTTRSHRRKLYVLIDTEKARLLGNLAWAHLQKDNYQTAEALYREALAIEPDKNKQCNLAICLIKTGRVSEAKSVLKNIRSSQPSMTKDAQEPSLKSYERACEMLAELDIRSTSIPSKETAKRDYIPLNYSLHTVPFSPSLGSTNQCSRSMKSSNKWAGRRKTENHVLFTPSSQAFGVLTSSSIDSKKGLKNGRGNLLRSGTSRWDDGNEEGIKSKELSFYYSGAEKRCFDTPDFMGRKCDERAEVPRSTRRWMKEADTTEATFSDARRKASRVDCAPSSVRKWTNESFSRHQSGSSNSTYLGLELPNVSRADKDTNCRKGDAHGLPNHKVPNGIGSEEKNDGSIASAKPKQELVACNLVDHLTDSKPVQDCSVSTHKKSWADLVEEEEAEERVNSRPHNPNQKRLERLPGGKFGRDKDGFYCENMNRIKYEVHHDPPPQPSWSLLSPAKCMSAETRADNLYKRLQNVDEVKEEACDQGPPCSRVGAAGQDVAYGRSNNRSSLRLEKNTTTRRCLSYEGQQKQEIVDSFDYDLNCSCTSDYIGENTIKKRRNRLQVFQEIAHSESRLERRRYIGSN